MRKQNFNQPGVILGDEAPLEQEAGMIDTVQWANPSSGGTVQIDDDTTLLMVDNPSLLLALTIDMPINPTYDRMLSINSRSGVTALTLNAPGVGQSFYATAVGALASSNDVNYFFSSDKNAWVRR